MRRRYLTVAEAAKLLRMGHKSVYAAIERGEIPAVRFGRLLRIPAEAVAILDDAPRMAA